MREDESERTVQVVPFVPAYGDQVVDLIVGIQRGEFAIDITADQQPDLRAIPSFYQARNGNFWVALDGERVVVEDALSGVRAGRAGGFGLVVGVARAGNAEPMR